MTALRNIFIAGLLLLVPVVITVWILQFLLGVLDDLSQPLLRLYIGREVPYAGAILTGLIVMFLGSFSNLFIGQRVVGWFERQVNRIPGVRTVYTTTRQVVRGFSTSDGMNFNRTVLIRREDGSMMIGFLTQELNLVQDGRPLPCMAVYVPTNHLYLGDVLIVPRANVLEVEFSLEEGMSSVLSCGGSLPEELAVKAAESLLGSRSDPGSSPGSA